MLNPGKKGEMSSSLYSMSINPNSAAPTAMNRIDLTGRLRLLVRLPVLENCDDEWLA